MRRRVADEKTFEGQLAAIAKNLVIDLQAKGRVPDYADFKAAFAPEIARMVIRVMVNEHRWLEGELRHVRQGL